MVPMAIRTLTQVVCLLGRGRQCGYVIVFIKNVSL